MKNITDIIKNFIKVHQKSIIVSAAFLLSLGTVGGILIHSNNIHNNKEKELLSRIASLEEQIKEYDELLKDNESDTDISNPENEVIDNEENLIKESEENSEQQATPKQEISSTEVVKQPTTTMYSETTQQNSPTVEPELKDYETNVDLKYLVFQYSANNTCYISGYNGTYEELILPKYFEGKKILGITSDVNGILALHNELKAVTIPEGYEYIGNCAFRSCKNLKTVNLPNTLTKIGRGAFLFSGLTEIYIPSSVTSIEENAFITSSAFDNTDDENFTIKCETGSYAEQYAIENGIKCQAK